MTSYGVLYATTTGAWNEAAPYLEHGSSLAFIEVAPGRIICRPRFSSSWNRATWLSLTGAVELTDADITDEIRERAEANNL